MNSRKLSSTRGNDGCMLPPRERFKRRVILQSKQFASNCMRDASISEHSRSIGTSGPVNTDRPLSRSIIRYIGEFLFEMDNALGKRNTDPFLVESGEGFPEQPVSYPSFTSWFVDPHQDL